VPYVIHLKHVGAADGPTRSVSHQQRQQQQRQRGQQQQRPQQDQRGRLTARTGLECIDLTLNGEDEGRMEGEYVVLPPFTSSYPNDRLVRMAPPSAGAVSRAAAPDDRMLAGDALAEDGEKLCAHCGAGATPEWLRGPAGRGTLCNTRSNGRAERVARWAQCLCCLCSTDRKTA
jgi:hypothetical protein